MLMAVPLWGAENLKLNSHLDYSSDSQDGPLITGDHMEDGASRRQAELHHHVWRGLIQFQAAGSPLRGSLPAKYKGRVQFVVIDLDQKQSPAQQELVKKYFAGSIPHVVVLDRSGNAVYNSAGEVEESTITAILDKALK